MSKVYDDPKYNAAFDRCVDVMARLLQKYGPQLLGQMQETYTLRICLAYAIINTQRVFLLYGVKEMDCKTKIKELRESTGMNRKEFCKYFQIPYRTVTEWELDNRHAPEYVLRLLEYYIQNEGLAKKKVTDECSELEERGGLHEKN